MFRNFFLTLLMATYWLSNNTIFGSENLNVSNIDEILVEGTKIRQTEREAGSSISIITSEQIAKQGFSFALGAIASAPGVTVNQNGAFGGQATVRIRGADSEQTLVLIDGMPVNDPTSPGGGYDFGRLDTENIERIEILKGPQSTLWGTDAIGGVISIITKNSKNKFSGNSFSEYGSFSSYRLGATATSNSNKNNFRISAVGLTTKGISQAESNDGNTEKDPYKSYTLSAKNSFILFDDFQISGSLLWSNANKDFDNFGPIDGDLNGKSKEITSSLSVDFPTYKNIIKNLLLIGYTEITRKNFTEKQLTFQSEGSRLLLRNQSTLEINDNHLLAFGIEAEETKSESLTSSVSSIFTVYELNPFNEFIITAGFRIDDHKNFQPKNTARLTLAYNPSERLTIRSSWGEGYKIPTIFQKTYICNFCGLTEPNPSLKPEVSEAIDIGFELRNSNNNRRIGLTFFKLKTENEINFSFATGYDNIDKVRSSGVELNGYFSINNWLSISLGYSFINAKESQINDSVLKPRRRVPRHSGDMQINFNPEGRLSSVLLIRHNGREPDGNIINQSWTRVDISGNYIVSDKIEIYSRIENLLDVKYQEIIGYGTPGISGSVGLRLRY